MNRLTFSKLNKTWLFDLDGTLVIHNGHLDGGDILIDGVKEFFNELNKDDIVIILTSRKSIYKEQTEKFLLVNNIRYDKIIYDLPHGERILINDDKPSGLKVSHAISKKRDEKFNFKYNIDKNL